MESKDRVDGLVKLAEFRTKRWVSRREIEWKISIGLWALLAAAVFYLRGRAIPIYFGPIVVLGHAVLTEATRVRNWRDQWFALHYAREAETLLLEAPLTQISGSPELTWKERLVGFASDYSAWTQVGTTALLVIALYRLPAAP